MRIYHFGGAIRDQILGLEPKDLDYLVLDSSQEEFLEHFPSAKKVGRAKGVFIHNGAQYTLADSTDLLTELQNKDLTINALAMDNQGNLICTEQSRQDLQQKILRPVNRKNFFQDPVRVFRAARMSAKLPSFQVHPDLTQVMLEVSARNVLPAAIPERIGQEVYQACSCPRPGNFLRMLAETGNLNYWLEELKAAQFIPAGPGREDQSLLQYLCLLLDQAAGCSILVWMVLNHDLGKTRTAEIYWPRHPLHDYLGPKPIRSLGLRLKMPNRYILAAEFAAAWHIAAAGYSGLSFRRKIQLLQNLHRKKIFREFFDLLQILGSSTPKYKAKQDLQAILEVRLPAADQNQGPLSGKKLQALQIKALQDSRNDNCP